MPLTASEAADVAKRHDLGLQDAQALAVLADSIEEADDLAARFAPVASADDLADAVAERRGY